MWKVCLRLVLNSLCKRRKLFTEQQIRLCQFPTILMTGAGISLAG